MKTKHLLEIVSGSVLLLVGDSQLSAQSPLWLTNVNYESPALIAPIVLLSLPSESGSDLIFGVLGWTVRCEWTRTTDPATATVISTEVTPLNSHSSNFIYRGGEPDSSLEYRNLTLQIKAGLRIQHTVRWRSEFSLVGLYESVRGLGDSEVQDYWKRPFIGIEIAQNYSDVISDDIFQSRWDGIKLSGQLQMFVGSTTWWQTSLSLGIGKKLGWIFLRGNGSFLLGNSLNTVNQFLVGGSWDLPGTNPLYGYHYAEFRLDRGSLINGGIDVHLFGNWELGARACYLNSPTKTTYGAAVKLTTVWNGIGFNMGIGFPEDSMVHGNFNNAIAFAGLVAASFEPW